MTFGTQKHKNQQVLLCFVCCRLTNLGALQRRWWRRWPSRCPARWRPPPRWCRWWGRTAPWSCTPGCCWTGCGPGGTRSCHTPPRRSGTLQNTSPTAQGGTNNPENSCVGLWAVVDPCSLCHSLWSSFTHRKNPPWSKHWLKYPSILKILLFPLSNWCRYPTEHYLSVRRTGGLSCLLFFYAWYEMAWKPGNNLTERWTFILWTLQSKWEETLENITSTGISN